MIKNPMTYELNWRIMGFEPIQTVPQTAILPLNYTRLLNTY